MPAMRLSRSILTIIREEDVNVLREPRETMKRDGITADDHVINASFFQQS
jgi:hypothetical protein